MGEVDGIFVLPCMSICGIYIPESTRKIGKLAMAVAGFR